MEMARQKTTLAKQAVQESQLTMDKLNEEFTAAKTALYDAELEFKGGIERHKITTGFKVAFAFVGAIGSFMSAG